MVRLLGQMKKETIRQLNLSRVDKRNELNLEVISFFKISFHTCESSEVVTCER